MKRSTPPGASELHDAVAAEAEAAERLSGALGSLRRRAETRDADGLELALEQAQRASEGVARAAAERMRRTVALARALGLKGEPTLSQLAERAGGDLETSATNLHACLQRVARESSTLGICARFGAASCDRLLTLQRAAFGLHSGYGADGRLGGSLQGQGHRA